MWSLKCDRNIQVEVMSRKPSFAWWNMTQKDSNFKDHLVFNIKPSTTMEIHYTCITRSLGPRKFMCYISSQEKIENKANWFIGTREKISLLYQVFCYIRSLYIKFPLYACYISCVLTFIIFVTQHIPSSFIFCNILLTVHEIAISLPHMVSTALHACDRVICRYFWDIGTNYNWY